MKKIFYTLFFAVLGSIVTGCNSKPDVPSESEYMEACKEQDWGKAYDICEEINDAAQQYYAESERLMSGGWFIGEGDWYEAREMYSALHSRWRNALEYVVLQECVYAIENNPSNIIRVAMIMKEHDCDIYPELIDVALATGDEYLISRIYDMAGGEDYYWSDKVKKQLVKLGLLEDSKEK